MVFYYRLVSIFFTTSVLTNIDTANNNYLALEKVRSSKPLNMSLDVPLDVPSISFNLDFLEIEGLFNKSVKEEKWNEEKSKVMLAASTAFIARRLVKCNPVRNGVGIATEVMPFEGLISLCII